MAERDLTVKQRKWLKLYVELGNATEAAMQVYDCKDRESACAVGVENLRKLRERRQFSDYMEAAGITPGLLAQKLKEGLDAMTITRAQKDGKFLDVKEDVDYPTRHRYQDTAHKLTGDYAASKHELSGPDGGPMLTTTQLIAQAIENGEKPKEDDDATGSAVDV